MYDSEDNHVLLVRDILDAFSVISARYVTCTNTKDTWEIQKKQMKHGYSKLLYGQRNKDETIISVIKRLFGEHITSSRLVGKNAEQRAIS